MRRGTVAQPMRIALAAVLVALLAGCAAPETTKNPLFGYCPDWVQGPGNSSGTLHTDAASRNATADILPPGNLSAFQGKPLDLYRMRVDTLSLAAGTLQLRATSEGRRLNWRDLRGATPQSVPVLTFPDASAAGHEFEVILSSVSDQDAPQPGPLHVEASYEGSGRADLGYTVTFLYRVCGASL